MISEEKQFEEDEMLKGEREANEIMWKKDVEMWKKAEPKPFRGRKFPIHNELIEEEKLRYKIHSDMDDRVDEDFKYDIGLDQLYYPDASNCPYALEMELCRARNKDGNCYKEHLDYLEKAAEWHFNEPDNLQYGDAGYRCNCMLSREDLDDYFERITGRGTYPGTRFLQYRGL